MPTSIDPPPAEDEFECANCGAYFHYDLTRCPNCGINLYEPEENDDQPKRIRQKRGGIFRKLKEAFHRAFNKPYSADEIFGDALDASILYNDLLLKVGGDRSVVERLIEFEKIQEPTSSRKKWLQNAIQRWDHDNSPS